MADIADKFGKASIDTDYAIATTVKTTRVPGATVLEAFDLSKYSDDTPVFFVTYKKTTDPVTDITSVTNLVSWKGLVNTGANTLTNLELAPGYADTGNAIGDFIECIPTSHWVNSLIEGIFVGHNPDGTFKKARLLADLGGDAVNPVVRAADNMYDHVASGVVIAGLGYGTNLNASMSAGVVYINGNRQTVAAVATRSYTPSKDTYVDLLYNVSGVATPVYTEVANNAASPALAANSIRVGIVVSGAANIANAGSVNQGEQDKLLPITSSTPYQVTDSLGNMICPRDPFRKIIGYRQSVINFAGVGATETDITGMSVPINILPSMVGRKVRIRFVNGSLNGTAGERANIKLKEGATVFQVFYHTILASNGLSLNDEITITPSAGVHTYKASLQRDTGSGTVGAYAASNSVSQISVELM